MIDSKFRWSFLKTPYPMTTPTEILGAIENQLIYSFTYDFTHASTSNTSPGLSLDTNFPIFDSTLYEAYLMLICECSVDKQIGTGYFLSIIECYEYQ